MTGRQPDAVIACVGGGSNAMGIFYPYIDHANTRLIGVEAAGLGLTSGKHAASISAGAPGVLHGNRTYLLQDANGQIIETHSISAGSTTPVSAPSTPTCTTSGAPNTSPSPIRRRSPRSIACAAPRASSRRSNRAMRSRMR